MEGDQQPDWQRREEAVERARQSIGEGATYGTVTVEYDSPAYDTGQVWVKGSCGECGGESVMRASHAIHMGYLAMCVSRYVCPTRGHQQPSN